MNFTNSIGNKSLFLQNNMKNKCRLFKSIKFKHLKRTIKFKKLTNELLYKQKYAYFKPNGVNNKCLFIKLQ